jgi:hypothetical protein
MYTETNESAPNSIANAGNEIPCLESALIYQRMGWSVVPIKPGGKSPDGSWKRFQQIAANEDTIRHWFRQNPERGVGVVVGSVSGIVAIDIDSPEANGRLLEISRGDLPSTWLMETTPGQKWRLLYRLPPGEAPRRQILWRDANGKELAIMGDGSQVVMPPSRHPLGHHYRWIEGGPDLMPDGPAMAPQWLMDLIGEPEANLFEEPGTDEVGTDQVAEPASAPATTSASISVATSLPSSPPATDDSPGEWLNRQHPGDILLRHGWTFVRNDGQQDYYQRPGHDASEHGATVKIGIDGKWNIQNFTSTTGLAVGHYDPFGLLACLEHGGDRSAAASAIRKTMAGPNPFEGVVIDPATCPVDAPPASMPKEASGGVEELFSVQWLDNLEPKPETWLVPGLIPEGVITAIAGDPGSGKTSIVRSMCAQLASGRGPLARSDGQPVKSLWLCSEDAPASSMTPAAIAEGLTKTEGARIGFANGLDAHILDAKAAPAICKQLIRHDVRLVVVDTLALLASRAGLDLNSGKDSRAVFSSLDRLCHGVPGLSVVVICHNNRSKDNEGVAKVAGSHQILSSVRLCLMVERSERFATVLTEVKSNLSSPVEQRRFTRITLSRSDVETSIADGGWDIKAEIDDQFSRSFCKQVVKGVTFHIGNDGLCGGNHIDTTTGLITVGTGGLPAPVTREQKLLKQNAELEAIKKSILHRLEVAARPIPWSDIVDGAALGTGDRILRKARLELSESGQVVVKKQPGSNTTIIELAKPIEPLPADLNLT